jgi:hypothetical protein
MDRTPDRQSAKILIFPTRRRAAASDLGNKAKFAAEVALLRTINIAGESAWYHQAEIEEAARNRKH